jgi:hypothetical protein
MSKGLIMSINSTSVRNLIKHVSPTEGNWRTQKSDSLKIIREFANTLDSDTKKNKLSLIIECSHVILKKGSLLFGGNTPLIKESLINQLSELNSDKLHDELSNIALAIEKLVTHKHETFSFKTSTTKRMDYLFQGNTVDNAEITGIPNKYRQTFSNTRNYTELRQIVKDYQEIDKNGNRYNILNNQHHNDYNQDSIMKEAHDMIYLLMSSTNIKQITQQAERKLLSQLNNELPPQIQTHISENDSNNKILNNIKESITLDFNEKKKTIKSLTDTNSKLDIELQNLEKNQKILKDNLDYYKKQLFDTNLTLGYTTRELEKLRSEYTNKETEFEQEKNLANKQIALLTTKNSSLAAEKTDLELKIIKLEEKSQNLITDLESLTKLKIDISNSLIESQKMVNKLDIEKNKNTNEINDLKQKIKNLKQKENLLNTTNSNLQNQVQSQKLLIEESITTIAEFSNELDRSTITKSITKDSNNSDQQNIFQIVDGESFLQDYDQYNRSSILNSLSKSQILIKKLDQHIAEDKANNLPGGFIERVEIRSSNNGYLTNKYDGIDEIRSSLNELWSNPLIQNSLLNEQDSTKDFMAKVVQYGIKKIDLKIDLNPQQIKLLEEKFKQKYSKSIEELEQAALVKILAIMYQVKQRKSNPNYIFNNSEQKSFCSTMIDIRKTNNNLSTWLPTQKLGSIFDTYSKNIKPAYQNDYDVFLLGNNSFNVKVDIAKITESFINKSNNLDGAALEQPIIVRKFNYTSYGNNTIFGSQVANFGKGNDQNDQKGILDQDEEEKLD